MIRLFVLLLAAVLAAHPAAETPDAAWAVRGTASWYALKGPGLYAAMPEWTWGDEPFMATVCHGERCIRVEVNDNCYCRVGDSERVIDLSRDAFRRLAPLSRGLIAVEVTVGVENGGFGPEPTPPATDVGP